MSNTTPICRCRVLYLGSAVPHITKDGLQGIQEPLRDLYPDQGPLNARGIDSWLSVWSNGLLLENVDESRRQVTRFYPIETLHYCAAVRYVVVPGNGSEKVAKFLPLDSPFARYANPNHPPLFACILRRTTGIKVLECHAFICKREAASNALVRCCFHAYADSTYVRQVEENPYSLDGRRSRSVSALDTVQKVEAWRTSHSDRELPERPTGVVNGNVAIMEHTTSRPVSRLGGADDDNYKVWTGMAPTERELVYVDAAGTIRSLQSGANGLNGSNNIRSRPRQMIIPSKPPPPPPLLPSMMNGKEIGKGVDKKGDTFKKKNKKHAAEPIYHNGFHPAMMPLPPPPPPPPSHTRYAGSGLYTERRVRRPDRPGLIPVEEPLYTAAGRPLSPMSTYQPTTFPHEQYYMQSYGTAPRSGKHSKKDKSASGAAGNKSSDLDSPFNTGIYKKKGHLNERAFSYSIRQEHRSRSTSLANLHFGTSGAEDVAADGKRGMAGPQLDDGLRDASKKDRELAQMVTDLELKENGDAMASAEVNFIRKKAPVYQR